MQLNNQQINVIRDTAIFLESKSPEISIDLMSVALYYRPNGTLIINKFNDYKKNYQVSSKIEESFQNACTEIVGNSLLLIDFMGVATVLYAKNKVLLEMQKNTLLFLRIDELEKQVELLRSKFNQMHKALNYSGVLKIKEMDDHAAKLSPIEFFDNGANETLIVFSGMATKPSMPTKEFFASFSNKKINIIFIKDFQQCWYQNGLMGLTDDIDSTIDYLKDIIPVNTTKLICLGTSAGGYAAIRMGVSLGAKRILAFSPQTKLNAGVFEKFKSVDSRANELSSKDNCNLDLKLLLSTVPNESHIEVFYGGRNVGDSNAAKYISDFSDLHEYDTDTHAIAKYLKSTGELSSILDDI